MHSFNYLDIMGMADAGKVQIWSLQFDRFDYWIAVRADLPWRSHFVALGNELQMLLWIQLLKLNTKDFSSLEAFQF
jgi:hypothetical protein